MKGKISLIILTAVSLSIVGAFYYEGAPKETNANEKELVSNEIPQSQKYAEYKDGNTEKFMESNEIPPANKIVIKTKELEETGEVVQSSENKERITEKNKDANDETQENEEEQVAAIKYGDLVYVEIIDVSENNRLKHIMNVAAKYGSKLYGVQDTDLYAMFKNGEIIFTSSTGYASASSGYSELLKEVFTGGGFVYEGMTENIDFVKKTGAKVSVEFTRHKAYTIDQKEDGWITVSW
ncbi:hypothetical protein [Cytobacillus firmus]|uniref:hypothetical protein n=1 Tax=Cytobacillus firmus TaxID=1399 RepID=UPI0024C14BFD|nr:hypothetical protein [Cytobacillus firmus]WHY61479.1 hypothetical protein QNH42_23405 [Cytobacillus firmus]